MELEKYKDLLQVKKSFVQVALIRNDGRPHVTPLWFDMSDEDLKNGILNINTATGRVKAKALSKESQVALSIQDPDDSYRHIGFQGRVINVIMGQQAEDHIDKLAKKYLNQDKYPYRNPKEERIKVKIQLETKYGIA